MFILLIVSGQFPADSRR